MAEIIWDKEAKANYLSLMDTKMGLPLVKRQQIFDRLEALKNWPPKRWFALRKDEDGLMLFQMDSDQFLMVQGSYHEKKIKITKFELRKAGK